MTCLLCCELFTTMILRTSLTRHWFGDWPGFSIQNKPKIVWFHPEPSPFIWRPTKKICWIFLMEPVSIHVFELFWTPPAPTIPSKRPNNKNENAWQKKATKNKCYQIRPTFHTLESPFNKCYCSININGIPIWKNKWMSSTKKWNDSKPNKNTIGPFKLVIKTHNLCFRPIRPISLTRILKINNIIINLRLDHNIKHMGFRLT